MSTNLKMQLLGVTLVALLFPMISSAPILNSSCLFSDLDVSIHTSLRTSGAASSGTSLTVECKEEYKEATSTVSCKDGQWSKPDPKCERVVCPTPKTPHGGFMQLNCPRVNCTVTYTCKKGFWYNGTIPRVCKRNGTWSPALGKCEAVHCPFLPDPEHGKMLQDDRSYGAEAHVECDEGYIYSKRDLPRIHWRCGDNNVWDAPEKGTCEAVQCPILADPLHGRFKHYARNYKARATIQCDKGYSFSSAGRPVRYCLGDNTWSKQEGECQAVKCPDLTKVDNGKISTSRGVYEDKSILQCAPGYTLSGPGTLICQANGNWSDQFGSCVLPAKEQESVKVQLPAILSYISMVILCIVIVLVVWKKSDCWKKLCWSQRSRQNDEENIPLLRKDRHYCSFILATDFKDEYKKEDSPEYMQFSSLIKTNVEKTIKFYVDMAVTVEDIVVCKGNKTVFVEIACATETFESNLSRAFNELVIKTPETMYAVVPGSLQFREKMIHYLIADVHKKRHSPDKHLDRSIDLDTQYVRLKLLSSKSLGVMHTLERPDLYKQYLEHHGGSDIIDEDLIKSGDIQKYILIRGRAGIGKSTLVQRLVWKWANDDWGRKFKAMFLLNLRHVMKLSTPVSLSRLLSSYALYNTGRPGVEFETGWIMNNQSCITILLDGIDEIFNFKELWEKSYSLTDLGDEALPLDWCFALMKRICLKKTTIIISSRPFADLGLLEKSRKEEHMEAHFMRIEVMGLTRELIMEFIERNTEEEKGDYIKQVLTNNPILLSVCSITFYCAALCQVLEKGDEVIRKLTTYSRITEYIIEMYIRRSMKNDGNTPEEIFDKDVRETLEFLMKLASDGMFNPGPRGLPQLVFDEEDLAKIDDGAHDLQKRGNIGLLMETEILNPEKSGDKHILSQFIHLSVQEFLAVTGLLNESFERIRDNVRWLSGSQQYSMARLFLYGLGFDEEVGLLRDYSTGSEVSKEEVTKLLVESVAGISNDLQALQVAHESQASELAMKVGQSRFKGDVSLTGTKLTAIDVIAITFMLRHHQSIHTLRLTDVGLDLISVKQLTAFIKDNKSIKTLELVDEGLSDTCLAELMESLKGNTSVRSLKLDSKTMTDNGVATVADGLEANKTIQSLTLECSKASGVGLTKIAMAAMKHEELEELSYTSDRLSDKSVQRVSVVLKERRIKKLSLFSDGITDNALKCIADALNSGTALQELRLHSDEISDSGVVYLSESLPGAGTLQNVCLRGFCMKQEGLQAIVTALETNTKVQISMWTPDCDEQFRNQVKDHPRITFEL